MGFSRFIYLFTSGAEGVVVMEIEWPNDPFFLIIFVSIVWKIPLNGFMQFHRIRYARFSCVYRLSLVNKGNKRTRPDTRRLVCVLLFFENNAGRTDLRRHLRTDLRTDTTSYRDATAHLKKNRRKKTDPKDKELILRWMRDARHWSFLYWKKKGLYCIFIRFRRHRDSLTPPKCLFFHLLFDYAAYHFVLPSITIYFHSLSFLLFPYHFWPNLSKRYLPSLRNTIYC